MKVSDMIQKLEQLKSEHGDLELYVFADHGQQLMRGYSVAYSYIDSLDEYMPEECHEDDLDEDCEHYKVVVIEG